MFISISKGKVEISSAVSSIFGKVVLEIPDNTPIKVVSANNSDEISATGMDLKSSADSSEIIERLTKSMEAAEIPVKGGLLPVSYPVICRQETVKDCYGRVLNFWVGEGNIDPLDTWVGDPKYDIPDMFVGGITEDQTRQWRSAVDIKEIQEALNRGHETAEEISKISEIDLDSLKQPMTI